MSSKVSKQLTDWIAQISDPCVDPWQNGAPDPDPVSRDAVVIDPTQFFNETSDEWTDSECGSSSSQESIDAGFTYKGKKDSKGRFHSYGALTFDNGDVVTSEFEHGIRHGDAVIISERNNISRLCGTYVNGKLQHKATLVSSDMIVTECFLKDGVIHGPVRKIGMKKFREFRRQLLFVGHYKNGRPFGPCWEYREGGGFVHGVPDSTGKFTGDQIAFIYPDHSTALVGQFIDGVMAGAKEGIVQQMTKDDDGVLYVSKYSDLLGPPLKYSKATKTSMGEDILVRDPYESHAIECRQSDVSGAGEGLFAIRDLPMGTIAAFYNGVRLPYALGGPKEVWESSGYKIYINADFKSGERMNIPEEFVSIEKYCATLGHKMNHSFRNNCVEWFFDHPRFGVIPCERTIRDVKAGEELFLDYEYDPYNCPDWFRDALIEYRLNLDYDEYEALSERYKRFQVEEFVNKK